MQMITLYITCQHSPYYDVSTSCYTVETEQGVLLFDCGSFDSDFFGYVQPLLEERGVTRDRLSCVFLSHDHEDHAGGLPALLEHYPDVTVFSRSSAVKERYPSAVCPQNGDRLLDVLQVVTIPGHTPDSMGLLDTRTATLLSGDSLQLYGLFGSGEWGANIPLPQEHFVALKHLRDLDIRQLVTAHDYHPYGALHNGREEVERALDACEAPLLEIQALLLRYPTWEDKAIRDMYQAKEHRPTVPAQVISGIRKLSLA